MEINKIYNEDCLVTMGKMSDNFIDLTITSPPYNLGVKHHTGNKVFDAYDDYIDNIPENEYQQTQIKVLNELFRVTKQAGSLMYNHKNRIRSDNRIENLEWVSQKVNMEHKSIFSVADIVDFTINHVISSLRKNGYKIKKPNEINHLAVLSDLYHS